MNLFILSKSCTDEINYRYHTDLLDDGKETLRAFGLLSDKPYAMESTLTNPFYVSVSINLVSP